MIMAEKIEKTNLTDIIKQMNVYQRISAVSTEVGKVKMGLDVSTGFGTNTYKASSINDVVDALTPLLGKYRLIVLPAEKEILMQEQIEKKNSKGQSVLQFFIRMKAIYRVINIDNPAEFVETVGYGDGIDTGDKAFGKSLTYARKVALIDVFNLSRGDDPDAEASPQEGYERVQKQAPKPKQEPKQEFNQSAMAVEHSTLIGELRALNIDVHEDTVANYIKEKAQVKSIDGGYLLTDLPAMSRVIAVMKAIIQSKK